MMKKILLIFFIVSMSTHAIAQIHGTAMGGISTVTSEGAIDTTRNPALLGTLSSPLTSLYLMGTTYYNQNANPEFHASGLDIQSIDQRNEYYYSFSLFAGYAKPAGKGTLGYSLSSKENFYLRRKDTQKLLINPSIEQTESTITDEFNPTLSIAYGWKIVDNNFAGVHLAVTPFFSSKKTDNKNTLSTEYSYTTLEYGFFMQPTLGFLLINNDSQVGLRFIPSTIKCVKKKTEADISATELSYSDRWDIQHFEGPQIIAGGYTKILPKTGIAIEFGIILPSSYTNTEIDVTDGSPPAIKHSSVTIHNDPIITMKTGIHHYFSEKIECMAGAAFFHLVNTAGSSNTYGRGKYNLLLFTFGSNYSLSPAVILSTLVLITNSSFESFYHAEDTISVDAKVKSTSWNVIIGAGLSHKL